MGWGGWRLTFEGGELLQLAVVAEAETGGAGALVLLGGRLGTTLFAFQQLGGGRDTVASLPVRTLSRTGRDTGMSVETQTETERKTLRLCLTWQGSVLTTQRLWVGFPGNTQRLLMNKYFCTASHFWMREREIG